MKKKTGYKANRPSPTEVGLQYKENQRKKLFQQVIKNNKNSGEALKKLLASIGEKPKNNPAKISDLISTDTFQNFNGS